ncbi:LysR family transcriptional regulator [Actinomadura sp. 9N215]|uniref:LysR family transcriptional regulator n=1 Tax=Actinomadura sp. 9N215 TaxID=3375150 RepID=UPI00379E40AD
MLDVQRLRVLAEVAEHGSFSGAAQALYCTQPAVSRQIAALERELGVPLVRRLPRGVRLTQAGELLHAHARVILASVAAAEREVRGLARLDGGRLRMAAFATANTSLVPSVIAVFRERHPGVELALMLGRRADETLAAVRAGELDLALMAEWGPGLPGDADGLDVSPLLDDRLCVALGRGHRLAPRRRVRLADLADETWIDGAHPDCCGPLDRFHEAAGFRPRIGLQCDDWHGKQALVASGAGIMLFPELARPRARDDIVLRPTVPALPARRVLAVTGEARHRPPAAHRMLDLLRRATEPHRAPPADFSGRSRG